MFVVKAGRVSFARFSMELVISIVLDVWDLIRISV